MSTDLDPCTCAAELALKVLTEFRKLADRLEWLEDRVSAVEVALSETRRYLGGVPPSSAAITMRVPFSEPSSSRCPDGRWHLWTRPNLQAPFRCDRCNATTDSTP